MPPVTTASLDRETLLGIPELARRYPGRNGSRMSPSTLIRWINRGARAADGRTVVRLDAIRIGGKWATSREALDRFFAAIASHTLPEPPAFVGPDRRRKASEAAAKELEAAGV